MVLKDLIWALPKISDTNDIQAPRTIKSPKKYGSTALPSLLRVMGLPPPQG